MSPGEFYSAVYNKAIELGANDVQARLAASQASEETGFGQHMVGNNLFGIKAGSTYTGPSVSANTQEEYNGNTVTENANFRAYDDFTGSVRDYLGFIQSNFPDAWSAETFSDAVKGLDTGVFGKYATRSAYGQHIKAIDNKYGGLQFAQDPQNVPTPYGPTDQVDLAGLPDDVVPVADPNFVNADPQFAFAQSPANVPVPEARPNIPTGDILSAFQANPDYKSPFDAILSPAPVEQQENEWGVINGVGPVYTPTFNSWAPVAAAEPISAPMGSVQATADIGAAPALEANATARPMMNVPALASLATTPGVDANTAVRGLPDIATVSSRMGIAEPGFDQSRFDGNGVSVATDFDPGRFASPPAVSFDDSRFGPLSIDVASNTQSFIDQPAATANLGSFPSAYNAQQSLPSIASPADIASFADAYSAQRGAPVGLDSAESQAMRGHVEYAAQKAMQDPQLNSFATPTLSVPAMGQLAANAPLSAQATVPGISQPAIDTAITGSTTPGLLSSTPIATANAPLSFTAPTGIIAGQPVQQNAFVDSFPSAVANNVIEPATVNDVVAAPTLDSIQVSEQPTVVDQSAVVEGPATTPALDQQAAVTDTAPATTTTTRTTPAKTTQSKGLLSGLLSKETVLGGALGGLALGPAGGLLGALAGQQIARNGGLSAMFGGNSFMSPTTQIAGGVNNIGGIYGGLYSPGTFAVANNGATITAQPGGYTTYTNKFGVTESIGPDGKIASYFGSNATPTTAETDTEGRESGGFFGGLFG